MPSNSVPAVPTGGLVVILGTGGTIAGTAERAGDNIGYTAAQRSVQQLLTAVPALAGTAIEALQLAQLDSKDMDVLTWRSLALAAAQQLARPEVAGLVVTHGTDTLEETGWLLQSLLADDTATKPLVLTAAMRPATALAADGPQNLLDAVTLARWPGARGVLAVLAGTVHAAAELRKRHCYRPDAFGVGATAGEAGPLGVIEEGRLRAFRPWPVVGAASLPLQALPADAAGWPWVEILSSHADARPEAVLALLDAGVRGLVIAATGNGTLHRALEPALAQARDSGVPVWICSRCADGVVLGEAAGPAAALTPWQARVALQLQLLRPR